jgi:hypothetical protein
MSRAYSYIGPKEIAERSPDTPLGIRVESQEDVLRWMRQTNQSRDAQGDAVATFIVDEEGWLRVSDRRSEHVACAGRKQVLSAGELAFAVTPAGLSVSWITNQSTGYCPDGDSWPAVQESLVRAAITAPTGFTQVFVFRACRQCGAINIIKDGLFECGVCASPLPDEWNR